MPIYQYDCRDCDQRVEVLFRSASTIAKPKCPECGSRKLARVMSQFARGRTEAQRLEAVDFTQHEAALEKGGEREFAKWARGAGAEYDEALGSNYRELAEKAEAGEDPVERIDAGYSFRYKVEENKAKAKKSESKSKKA